MELSGKADESVVLKRPLSPQFGNVAKKQKYSAIGMGTFSIDEETAKSKLTF